MVDSNTSLADRQAITSVKLIRWLTAEDPTPQLTGPQASALAIIVYSGQIKPSELAELEKVKRPTVARTIGQLADRKLVTRKLDPSDARSVFLEPTAAGKKLIKEGQRRRIEPLRQRLTKITTAERQTLTQALLILEKIVGC